MTDFKLDYGRMKEEGTVCEFLEGLVTLASPTDDDCFWKALADVCYPVGKDDVSCHESYAAAKAVTPKDDKNGHRYKLIEAVCVNLGINHMTLDEFCVQMSTNNHDKGL